MTFICSMKISHDITGELNSPQIGADSHELLAEILVKIFARAYHDITTFSAYLHETSTILYEFLRHTNAILRYLFDITTGLYELLGQRHINITRNAIGPKCGQKDCRKF